MTHNTKPEEGKEMKELLENRLKGHRDYLATLPEIGENISLIIKYRGIVHELEAILSSQLSPSSTAPQPLDSIVDEYYDVYCPSKGITGIYTDDFVAFLSEGFTIQKKQP